MKEAAGGGRRTTVRAFVVRGSLARGRTKSKIVIRR
jgi:hypothetical protein